MQKCVDFCLNLVKINTFLTNKEELTRDEFKNIYDQFFDAIRNYIYYRSGDSELATDIAQETFIKVWEKQFSYEPKKIKGLLYKISSDLFISHYRREKLARDHQAEIKFCYKEEENTSNLEYEE